MQTIKRIFVEKKPGCDVEAVDLFHDLTENLGIHALESVRILVRYDVEGMEDEHFETCKNTIFAEPPVDKVYDEKFDDQDGSLVFAIKYLPGQYDQRADSAMQCIQIVTGMDMSQVEAAKVIVCKGSLSTEDKDKIKAYCINPVDSMEASLNKPASLKLEMPVAEDVKDFDGFIEMSEPQVLDMRETLGLAMSGEDLLFCQAYFRDTEKRNPTVTEIRVIDTYWSDHCRHTTFLTTIKDVEFVEGQYTDVLKQAYRLYLEERKNVYGEQERDICLMDMAVMGMKALKKKGILRNLDESEEINACSIVIDVDVDGKDEEWLLMFKNETHNHPTEIEPFGGAATCLGGAIRDPLSGRSYVYQAMRVTGSGDPRTLVKDTLPGKLPQRKITKGAAHGYSSYGNQIGLATGQVTEIYDEGYVAKRMEIGAVVGAVKRSHVVRERPEAGDMIILVGGRTGRDGCGGATGSSKEHTEESILSCGAEVQKGNPPTERKLQRLFRKPEASQMIKRCNDFGAGGVSVAIGELADGLVINLDAVLKKYDGLDGTELAISESQERMAVVVAAGDVETFIHYAMDENLEAVKVAVVTDDRRLVMRWREKEIVNIARSFLDTNGVKQKAGVILTSPEKWDQSAGMADEAGADGVNWLNNLKQLNVAAQKGLTERFDSTIGAGTVLMPFGGQFQLTPAEVMAAKIPLEKGETSTVSLMSFGYNPDVSKWSPFHGAVCAVVESVSKIVAAGGAYQTIRLTFQEYFEKLGADPHVWQKPFGSLLGAFYAQMMLGIPAIGGKDSMSGTFKDMNVPPTLVSFAVNVGKVDDVISPEFKAAGHSIVRLNTVYDKNDLPGFNELKKNFDLLKRLIQQKKVLSAYTIGFGGVAAAITKMAVGNKIGVDITLDDMYQPSYGSFVVEFNGEADLDFAGYDYEVLGQTTSSDDIKVNGEAISIYSAVEAWLSTFETVFPTGYIEKGVNGEKAEDLSVKPYSVGERLKSKTRIAKPRVFIPVFPGTNCEYDTKKEFEKAGAIVETFVVKNFNIDLLETSIREFASKIQQSQMIALPGGFSAGDEPDGSGKFIAAVFRNPSIKEAVMELLNHRDGLMLGICNGFQALVKLGLLPYGEIRDLDENSPTLTFNEIGRHISCLAKTKIIANHSPWLWNVNAGDEHWVAVSHGEGRFMANPDVVKQLALNHQIATQYVDFGGNPTHDIRFNPNGSYFAIEGITSPDGRVFGKMGHSERIGYGLYKNIDGEKEQGIFQAGVGYFQ